MKVMWGGVGGTYVALVRLIVTEHGISYRGRPLGKRSAQSNREGYVSKGADGRAIHRVVRPERRRRRSRQRAGQLE